MQRLCLCWKIDHPFDFSEIDIVYMEVKNSAMYKQKKMMLLHTSNDETSTITKDLHDQDKEDETILDTLENLYISKEDNNTDKNWKKRFIYFIY